MRVFVCLLFVLLLTCWAQAATDDLSREDVLKMHVGEQRTLTFERLVRFSVKDSTVLVVRRIDGDQVVVEAIAPGNTWMEVVHGARAFTALRVQVEGPPVPQATPQISPAVPPSPSQPPSGPNQRAFSVEQNALHVGIEFDYGADTQHFPTLVTFVDANGRVAVADVSTTVKRRFQVVPVTIDWSASRLDRLTAVFPYVNTDQNVTSPLGSTRASGSGIGDVALYYERTLARRVTGGWETGVQISTLFPSGRSVYDALHTDELPTGVGHYQVGTALVVRRVSDPLAILGTFGTNYTLPRAFHAHPVTPGLGWNASTAISYAMSDQWALSEQISYLRRPNILLANAALTSIQNVDQAYLTQSVTYSNRRGNFLLRLMLTLGLNEASTDFVGGVSAQWKP